MRAVAFSALALIALVLVGVSSGAATGPGAIVTSQNGKTYVLKGAHCPGRRMQFGAFPASEAGMKMSLVLAGWWRQRVDVIDGYIDLRPMGVKQAMSGTVFMNADRRS